MNILDYIPYLIALMTFWDFSIHVIDWRDRKYEKSGKHTETWFFRMLNSKSVFSYYYPHFWGKPPHVSQDLKNRRYDIFWISFWGTAFLLTVIYILTR